MPASPSPPAGRWKILLGLAPAVALGAILVAWVAFLLYDQTRWWRRADEANVREWIDESRVFRKTLPEMARDYAAEHRKARGASSEGAPELEAQAIVIREQMAAMADPTRIHQGYLPLFLEVYRIEVRFAQPGPSAVSWESPVPRPQQSGQVRAFAHPVLDRDEPVGEIYCEYRLHAFAKPERDEEARAKAEWAVGALILGAGIIALIWVYVFLSRERRRELRQVRVEQAKEHAENQLLQEKLRLREAEHAREELVRHLLEQKLEASRQEKRAADAERTALEMKSQLYASIGIMAGSYAHNIKNLLVRPNDLLARCLEADGLSTGQTHMLHEVRSTLGTVTERLQQILATVRRDPSHGDMTPVDLNELIRDSLHTWSDMGREKWKLNLAAEEWPGPLWINGDISHLQQAVENLIFNARDATFEMRNHLREQARSDPALSPDARRRAVLESAAWKGEVRLRTRRDGEFAILEVSDNGIGMTDEVREQCTRTHFTTKRDNALYEGLSAGMGLGLSFVAVVLDHHGATMEIDSAPLKGTTFRLRFLAVNDMKAD